MDTLGVAFWFSTLGWLLLIVTAAFFLWLS